MVDYCVKFYTKNIVVNTWMLEHSYALPYTGKKKENASELVRIRSKYLKQTYTEMNMFRGKSTGQDDTLYKELGLNKNATASEIKNHIDNLL